MNPTAALPTTRSIATSATPSALKTPVTALETYCAIQAKGQPTTLGKIDIKDRQGCWWSVEVLWTVEWQHSLKFAPVSADRPGFYASAPSPSLQGDGLEASEGDRTITPDEWEIFAMWVDDRRNYALRMGAQQCLNRLLSSGAKAPEKPSATKA
ncbi:MAG: hypothetical protein HY785_19285 [Oscillatoriophycideae cyanobacterium NC_groundwater_1537_Pr4_S-0.65um_50_18]|nr:hypothetical protein [Oscillatoriophycideae cyanobacterium NC_groundwater_1537_Pr4_S-0.65um_50_18]